MENESLPAYKIKEFDDAFKVFDPNGTNLIDFQYFKVLIKTLLGIDVIHKADIIPEDAKNQLAVGFDAYMSYGKSIRAVFTHKMTIFYSFKALFGERFCRGL